MTSKYIDIFKVKYIYLFMWYNSDVYNEKYIAVKYNLPVNLLDYVHYEDCCLNFLLLSQKYCCMFCDNTFESFRENCYILYVDINSHKLFLLCEFCSKNIDYNLYRELSFIIYDEI